MTERTVFFLSDQTGVTAETLGHSLITQYSGQQFRQTTLPFIDTDDKAHKAVTTINRAHAPDGPRPIVFSTLVHPEHRAIVKQADGLYLDLFDAFMSQLTEELGEEPVLETGRAHGMSDIDAYMIRIEATNFALANDDGGISRNYEVADVILVGVSRSGKTPTCLYLALQYGVFAANYPPHRRRIRIGPAAKSPVAAQEEVVRADDHAGTIATDSSRTARNGQILVGAAGQIRVARDRKTVPPLRNSECRHDGVLN